MINNDTHPTLLKLKKTIIWAHLIDFFNFIYEQNIRVEFLSFLREKKKFSSLNELKGQLTKDCISVKEYLNKNSYKKILNNLNTFFGYNLFIHILFDSFKASSINLPMIIILLVCFPRSINIIRIILYLENILLSIDFLFHINF